MDFDKVLTRIGQWKRYQIYHYFLIGLAALPCGMNNMANVLLAETQPHWCAVPALANLSKEEAQRLSAPEANNGFETGYSSCKIYDTDYPNLDVEAALNLSLYIPNDTATLDCHGWHYDTSEFHYTIVSRWNLVCWDRWKKAMASSIYMAGFLMGAICIGSLSDKIGRKPGFYMSLVLMICTGLIATAMPNYWAHVLVRLLTGVSASGIFTCGFVLVMEIIGTDYRMIPGIFYQGFFAVGYMSFAVLGYFIRDYRWLLMTISLIPCLFLPYWWLLGESPRWLLIQGKTKQARKEVEKGAKMNKCDYPADLMEDEVTHLQEKSAPTGDKNYTIIDLLRTPNMRKKSLNVFFNWYVISLVYYGLSLGVSDLVGTPQVNLFISGFVEFPGFIFAALTLDRWGRRWPLAILMIGGGISCVLIPFLPTDMQIMKTVLAMIGKLGISGAFAIIYVFSAELFPTVVRTMGVGAGSMCARVGGLMAPFIAELGTLSGILAIPMLIFGGSSILAGLLALLLPETLHQSLPETLEDGELFGKGGVKILSCATKTTEKDDLEDNALQENGFVHNAGGKDVISV